MTVGQNWSQKFLVRQLVEAIWTIIKLNWLRKSLQMSFLDVVTVRYSCNWFQMWGIENISLSMFLETSNKEKIFVISFTDKKMSACLYRYFNSNLKQPFSNISLMQKTHVEF